MLTISPLTQKLLIDEYSQSHRHHHNYDHICYVLDVLRDYKELFSNFEAAELAAKFHDVVYNVDESYQYNEHKSCMKFLELIQLDNPNFSYSSGDNDFRTTRLVLYMIKCTNGHTLNQIQNISNFTDGEIEDIKMFLDADIKILAESEDRVIQFENDIRKEFSYYDDSTYRFGRIKVLQDFLNRPNIFMSHIGVGWEQKARKNLQLLIDILNYNS